MDGRKHISRDASFPPRDHHELSNQPSPSSPPSSCSSSSDIQDARERIGSAQAGEASLDTAFKQLDLADQPSTRMFRAIGAVLEQALTQDPSINLGAEDWQMKLQDADVMNEDGRKDIGALTLVRTMLDQLWSHRNEDALIHVATLLADGSREEEWRSPFGESHVLEFFLDFIASEDVNLQLRSQALRFIGNTCADTDINRGRAISEDYLPSIIRQLRDDYLADFAIPMLFNICVDYEPAQQAARSHQLFLELIDLVARDSYDSRSRLGFICPLLNYSLQDNSDAEKCPDYSIQTLLQLASEPEIDVEDLAALVNAIVIFLELERFQKILIAQDLVTVPLSIIIRSFSPQTRALSLLSVTNLNALVRDAEEEEQLSAIRSVLIRALSDVSAVPEFGRQYPIGSSLFDSLLGWLSSSGAHFQICSCIMLGNLARSDTVCSAMVQDLHLHEILATLLKESSDLQVLHSVLGFLRNLALPAENKDPMGAAGMIEAISRIWSMDFNVQLQYAAVGLTRQLLNGSIANVQRLLDPLSLDPDSPAHEKTYLSLLLSLFEATDQIPTKLEIARIIAAIWRCLNTTDQSVENDHVASIIQKLFSKHSNVLAPLAMMVSQSRWPVLRSEGWFALALIARSREGTAAINRVLGRVEFLGALVESITGKSMAVEADNRAVASEPGSGSEPTEPGMRPNQRDEMRMRDRENAMVLVSELLKNSGDDLSFVRRNILEALLRGGQSDLSFQQLIIEAQMEE